jgi:hypothetical protein
VKGRGKERREARRKILERMEVWAKKEAEKHVLSPWKGEPTSDPSGSLSGRKGGSEF